MHRVVDLFRDAVGMFCAFLTARIRPSQRALHLARIEQELRYCRSQLIAFGVRLSLMEAAGAVQNFAQPSAVDQERAQFEEIVRNFESDG